MVRFRTSVLLVCLLILAPLATAKPLPLYRIGFEAMARGPFAIIEGIPGDEEGGPPIIAFGQGEARILGSAEMLGTDGTWYVDPAALRFTGQIGGRVQLFDEAREVVGNASYQMQLRGLPSADARLSPADDLFVLFDGTEFPPETSSFDVRERFVGRELSSADSGDGLFLIAGPVEMGGEGTYEALILVSDVDGELRTLVFSEQPEIASAVDVRVTLRG